MYKEIWEAAVGEELVWAGEPHNSHNRYIVTGFGSHRDLVIWPGRLLVKVGTEIKGH